MTYSELYHSSIEISNYFTANYKNASKIALLLPNSIDMIKIINALTISPLEIILINFHLTNQEIINQLNQIDPSLLITNNQHDIHTAEDFPYPIHNISDIINESKNSSSQVSNNHSPQKNDILVNVFTSGTTGTPKIVPLSYFNFEQNIIASNDRLKVEINDNWLITIPLFHLGGLS
ncbi:MAG: AMP-binding protein, partial [Asgard group archaeon]|nr:AMP-binding protein [Asgard group archaeon]